MNSEKGASVRSCPHVSPTEQDRTGQNRTEQDTNVDSTTTSPHCPTGISRTPSPNRARARQFESWLVYEDEKEAIRAEAVVLQKRLHQLRRRWQAITAAQQEAA